MAIRRVKPEGFDLSIPPSVHFGIRSPLGYHEEFCDLTCYCQVTRRTFESSVNYCPYCGLNMMKVSMRKSEAS